jgi:hypothetical protein
MQAKVVNDWIHNRNNLPGVSAALDHHLNFVTPLLELPTNKGRAGLLLYVHRFDFN